MRRLGLALLGALLGLWVGLTASAAIGILGVLLLDRLVGVKYLDLIAAAVGAVGLPAWHARRAGRRREGVPDADQSP